MKLKLIRVACEREEEEGEDGNTGESEMRRSEDGTLRG